MPELRKSTMADWMETRRPSVERLVRFEQWLCRLLEERLQWPDNPAKKQRQIGQCHTFVNGFLCELERRGWLFDGPILAKIITEKIDTIAQRQKAGQVEDLWIYFRSCMAAYADASAEKFRDQAMSAGYHVSQALNGFKAIPEMVAERQAEITREKLTKARRRLAENELGADLPGLL